MKSAASITEFPSVIHSVCRIAMILCVSLLAPGVWAETPPAPWFKRVLVGMEVGPTGAQFAGGKHATDYARNFHGAEIVRRCAAANAEYLVLWVRDGDFTFHDSKWLPRPASFGDRDVLREAVEESRKLHLPIIAYCQLQYPAHDLRQHPEWKARQADGKPIDHLVCFNSPYASVVQALLAEMVEYGLTGFHLDMVDQGFGPPTGCWCEHCQKLFQAEYGRPMPKGMNWEDEDWDRMLQFRYATSDRFEKMLTEHVRRLNPQATVDFNYHGNAPFSWEVGQTPVVHAGNGDFVTGEAGLWAFGALFATGSEHHIVEARKLFANAVRLLNPNPRVRIDAPANVEAVVTDDPATRTLRVHLIAYNATPQATPVKERPYVLPGLIEDAPMYRARIELRDSLESAEALNQSTQLTTEGNRVALTVADIYEVIQCHY